LNYSSLLISSLLIPEEQVSLPNYWVVCRRVSGTDSTCVCLANYFLRFIYAVQIICQGLVLTSLRAIVSGCPVCNWNNLKWIAAPQRAVTSPSQTIAEVTGNPLGNTSWSVVSHGCLVYRTGSTANIIYSRNR
jgi:hypothetical protein